MAEKQTIGKYHVLGKIGEGGMGNIFKAMHPTLKRAIIIKQLRITSEKTLTERFKREARIMIDFRNDNIVQVYDHFREGSSYYIAMEYVDGTSLEKLIKHKDKISPMAALLILQGVAKGLKYAHDKGVIHRDIKPDNVLISKQGEVKLVDFGIATAREENEEDLTKTGAVIGTPAYMSPEQLSSAKDVDKRTDIYSLGVMFYKMVTGARPFPSSFTAEAIQSITKGIFVRPEKVNPEIPKIFKKIIKKTMNSKIGKRFKDLKFLLKLLGKYTYKYKDERAASAAITNYIKEPVAGKAVLDSVPIRKKRHIVTRIVVGLIFLAIAGLGCGFLYYKGYYHEYMLPKKYGSIEISAMVPKNYYKTREDVYAVVRIVNTDVKGISYKLKLEPPITDLPPILFINSLITGKKQVATSILTTEVKYIPAGNYNLELIFESEKYYRSFLLLPRELQKQKADTEKRLSLQFGFKDLPARNVAISHRVFDSMTNRLLTQETKISMKVGSAWYDWTRDQKIIKDRILSGQSYSFRYENDGYYAKILTFAIERNVGELNLDVALTAIPGTLTIESNTPGLEISIDNRKDNFIGNSIKKFTEYGLTAAGKRDFLLTGGNYVLTIKKDKSIANFQFTITNKQQTRLSVTFDKDKKAITVVKR
jgi:predicted Ser/Thr protein kinase